MSKRCKPRPQPKKSPYHAPSPSQNSLALEPCNLLRTLGRTLASTVTPSWHAVVSASAIAALIALGFSLWPRMTIDFSGPTDPTIRTSLDVTVRNSGMIPLNNIDAWVGVCFFSPPTGALHKCLDPPTWPRFGVWVKHNLSPDDTWSFSIADAIKITADSPFRAVFSVNLFYTPWILPITRERIAIIYMWRDADKIVHWHYAAPDEMSFRD
jgi:hypothetical protein